jgi:hypothetical protein
MKFTIDLLIEMAEARENSDDRYTAGLGSGLRIAAEAMQAKLETIGA